MAGRIGDDGLTLGQRRKIATTEAWVSFREIPADAVDPKYREKFMNASHTLGQCVDPGTIAAAVLNGTLGIISQDAPLNPPLGKNAGKSEGTPPVR